MNPAIIPDAPVDMDEIARFIHEDLGSTDLTALIVPATTLAEASVLTRVDMVLCGGPWFEAVFALLDPTVHINWLVGEGDQVSANELICKLTGPTLSY